MQIKCFSGRSKVTPQISEHNARNNDIQTADLKDLTNEIMKLCTYQNINFSTKEQQQQTKAPCHNPLKFTTRPLEREDQNKP